MKFTHSYFEIDFQRIAPNVWFPTFYCNVLWGGGRAGKVSYASGDFRKANVPSIEYVDSIVNH